MNAMDRFFGSWGAGIASVGFMLGAAGLMMVMIHLYAGPFAPQPALADVIADTAVDIRNSAARALAGEPAPPPVSRLEEGYDIDTILRVGVAVAGVAAIVLAVIGGVMGAPMKLALSAGGVGVATVMFQFVIWLAMLIAGVILLGMILANITEILGEFGG